MVFHRARRFFTGSQSLTKSQHRRLLLRRRSIIIGLSLRHIDYSPTYGEMLS
jgi:hypothetical protein